jgi:hypothetical protein
MLVIEVLYQQKRDESKLCNFSFVNWHSLKIFLQFCQKTETDCLHFTLKWALCTFTTLSQHYQKSIKVWEQSQTCFKTETILQLTEQGKYYLIMLCQILLILFSYYASYYMIQSTRTFNLFSVKKQQIYFNYYKLLCGPFCIMSPTTSKAKATPDIIKLTRTWE